jgi:hypothetical protein
MDRKVKATLTRFVKDKKVRTNPEGKPVLKEGKIQFDEFDRIEFASEVAKRLGVTRRTVRKARQGREAALNRISEATMGDN